MKHEFKKILIAVDASENAKRAVSYVGEIVSNGRGFRITLLYVLRRVERDLFPDESTWMEKIEKEKKSATKMLERLKGLLVEKGLDAKDVTHELIEISDFSIAQAIMDFQEKGGYGTVVIGRRGMSKAEEFLFGSISNKIVHYAKNCAVWVIE